MTETAGTAGAGAGFGSGTVAGCGPDSRPQAANANAMVRQQTRLDCAPMVPLQLRIATMVEEGPNPVNRGATPPYSGMVAQNVLMKPYRPHATISGPAIAT